MAAAVPPAPFTLRLSRSQDLVDDEDAEDEPDVENGVQIIDGEGGAGAVPAEKRMTTRFMTKYERARVLGTRALQISMNAPVMVELEVRREKSGVRSHKRRQAAAPALLRLRLRLRL